MGGGGDGCPAHPFKRSVCPVFFPLASSRLGCGGGGPCWQDTGLRRPLPVSALRRPPPSRLQPCMPSPKGQGAAGPPLCESPQLTQAAWAPPAMSTKERASIYSGKVLGIGRRRLEGGVHAVAVADPLLPRGDLAHRRSTGRSHSSAYVFAVWTTQ